MLEKAVAFKSLLEANTGEELMGVLEFYFSGHYQAGPENTIIFDDGSCALLNLDAATVLLWEDFPRGLHSKIVQSLAVRWNEVKYG